MNDHESWLQRTRAVSKDAIQRYDAFVKQIVADRDRILCTACNRDLCRHDDGQHCNGDKNAFELYSKTLQRYDIRVFDACEDLHGRITGSNDMPSKEALIAYGFLKMRLNEWQESTYSFSNKRTAKKFDDTVKVLCETVCKEYEQKHLQEDIVALVIDNGH